MVGHLQAAATCDPTVTVRPSAAFGENISCFAVRQTDIHSPTVTVYESLIFSARLRLPAGQNDEKVC